LLILVAFPAEYSLIEVPRVSAIASRMTTTFNPLFALSSLDDGHAHPGLAEAFHHNGYLVLKADNDFKLDMEAMHDVSKTFFETVPSAGLAKLCVELQGSANRRDLRDRLEVLLIHISCILSYLLNVWTVFAHSKCCYGFSIIVVIFRARTLRLPSCPKQKIALLTSYYV